MLWLYFSLRLCALTWLAIKNPLPERKLEAPPPAVLNLKSMYPLVNVLWTKVQGRLYFFVKLHPRLRYPDSLLGLDGVRQAKGPGWRKSQWERAERK